MKILTPNNLCIIFNLSSQSLYVSKDYITSLIWLKLMSFDPDKNTNGVTYSKIQNDSGWLQVELNFNDFMILKDNGIMLEHIQY